MCAMESEPAYLDILDRRLLDQPDAYAEMAHATNPYGNGTAAHQIAEILAQ